MPRKSKELTRMPLKKGLAPKWRRIYKGQIHYFRGSYDDALERGKRRKLNSTKRRRKMPNWCPTRNFDPVCSIGVPWISPTASTT